MPDNNTNGGLSLEALLAAARGTQEEAAETQPAAVEPVQAPAQSASATSAARSSASSAAAGAAAAGASAAGAQAVSPANTGAAEPVAEPSALVQEEALEKAEAAPAFDLAAALGYGHRDSEPEPAKEPEEKFDLAAALGYKSQEVREREAAEAAAAEAAAQAQAVQERAYRNAEHEARIAASSAARESRDTQPTQPERTPKTERPFEQPARTERADQAKQPASREQRPARSEEQAARGEREVASARAATIPQVRSRTFEGSAKPASVSPEERYAAKSTAAQSAKASDGSTIESYQPTKRDRSAQARAARPLNKTEVTEVAQAIAAQTAATEFVEETVEVVEAKEEGATKAASESKEKAEASASTEKKPAADEAAAESATTEKSAAEARFTKESDMQAASLGEPVKEAAPPVSEPVIPAEEPASAEPKEQAKSAEPAPAGQPLPIIPPAEPVKPVTMPHKVPVRTTEEVIRPTQPPVRLGVISPEAARHEAATKKKVQSAERKIVKKVRRFRTLGMFLIVLALAALAGAIFLFVAGNAQANESIEAEATKICEEAGRTITYRYKAADSNGTLCPTTEVATFSAGDVLEQSVITMNTPDFETAGHTLANFKRQFEKSSYVDGRVDGNMVIFTLHMSNERIMKVTYTALLMKNTTGCEVVI